MAILWRVNPRQGRLSFLAKVVNWRNGSDVFSDGAAGGNVNYDEFFGLVSVKNSSGTLQGQTIAVVASVTVNCTVTTAQGSQTIDASGFPAGDALIQLFQGQTIDSSGVVKSDASVGTSQGQSINATGSITAAASVTTSQGQTIDATATIYWVATVATKQGQTIDASGAITAAATVATLQGQTIDAVGSSGSVDGPVTTSQGETIDASGAVVTTARVVTEQGVRHDAALWRVSPRKLRYSWVTQLAHSRSGGALYNVAADEFFHNQGPLNGQSIAAVGDVLGFGRTKQGGQSIAAIGGVEGGYTFQGQTNDATGFTTAGGTWRTSQGQSVHVVVFWDIDATVQTKQGQTIAAVATVPMAAVITTAQGQTNDGTYGCTIETGQGQNVGGRLGGEFEQIAAPAGIDSLEWGDARIWSNKLNMSGFDSMAFGAMHVQNKKRPIQGFDTSRFGTAKIQNYFRYIQCTGINGMRFGTAKLKSNALQPRGFSTMGFGAAVISNYIRTLYLHSDTSDSSRFGTATISNYERELPLQGFDSSRFGTALIYKTTISMGVGSTMRFGSARISNWIRYLNPVGFDAQLDPATGNARFGNPTIFNYDTYVTPQGFDSGIVERPLQIAFRIRHIRFTGQSWLRFGTNLRISNWLQYVNLRGWDSSVVWDDFGPVNPATGYGARVWLARAPIPCNGFDSAAFGRPHLTQTAGPINRTPC